MYVDRRLLTRLQKLGYRFKSGFEAEFAVYRTEDGTAPLFDGKGVYISQCLAKVEPLLYALESGLAASGVDVLAVLTECGPGQMELAVSAVIRRRRRRCDVPSPRGRQRDVFITGAACHVYGQADGLG